MWKRADQVTEVGFYWLSKPNRDPIVVGTTADRMHGETRPSRVWVPGSDMEELLESIDALFWGPLTPPPQLLREE